MFILLCGTGVGFSVERQYVGKLPDVPEQLFPSDDMIVVHDSKEGWAKAFRKVIAMLYAGEIPKWDVSKVRPAGAKLKTFGGRASGPAPLVELFNFAVNMFVNAKGRKLSSMECHDLMCKIGEVVVVGGVRRSAMISLSNLSDDRMRHAKSGQWWEKNAQRALANNSVAYTEKPDMETFMREWLSLVESKSGERGIFSRPASKKQAAKNGRRAKTVIVTLEDGTKKEFKGNDLVNGKQAYLLQEGDEL
jgi:ribonucleoside-diphosphate reductase alpha chain